MRVKLQLVMCSDEGQEETITDVITLNKNTQRIEHLGLTLAEAKQLLNTLQRHLLQHQVDTFLDPCSTCADCGALLKVKAHASRSFRTLFGTCTLNSPRLEHCDCTQRKTSSFRPLAALLTESVAPGRQPRHRTIRAFLENQIGSQALGLGETDAAARHFQTAIDIDPAVTPAYVNLGDLRLARGDAAGAIQMWEALAAATPERAYLVLDRLRAAHTAAGTADRFEALCRRLIDAQPQDWRARLALAAHLRARGDARGAFTLLIDSLAHNPHAVSLHQATWETLVDLGVARADVDRYMAVSREAVYYRDPHICVRCRYRSNELLWQCPHCHEWNTFVEERLAAAHDGERAEG